MTFTQKIHENEIREIFQYWLERRPQGGVPDRDSIDPTTIPHKYLPDLFHYERDTRGRFRCKLTGTDLVRMLGKDETGRYLDESLDPKIAGEWLNLFTQAVDTGRPVYYRYRATTARGAQHLFSRILLPISSGGDQVDQVFGMVRYGPVERWFGREKPSGWENQLSEVVVATDDDLAVLTADSAAR